MICVARAANSVTLEASAVCLGPCWQLDVLKPATWASRDYWEAVPEHQYSTCLEDDSNVAGGAHRITVVDLQSETTYSFRIVRADDADLVCECSTAGPAPLLLAPTCVHRLPRSLIVEWRTPKEEEFPILECELQYCVEGTFYGQWSTLKVLSSAETETEVPASQEETLWRATVPNLTEATRYALRVRARNSAGWCPDYSEVAIGRTSDAASPPSNLQLSGRRVGAVEVTFDIEDPDGAPVHGVKIEVAGSLQWAVAEDFEVDLASKASSSSEGSEAKPRRSGSVIVWRLPSESDSMLRIWTLNAVGWSKTPSEVLTCQPAQRPGKAFDLLCVGRGLNSIDITWSTTDPEGAPVEGCSVEYAADGVFASWQPLRARAVKAISNEAGGSERRWRARIPGLEKESSYLLRVSSRNAVGESDKSTTPLRCTTAARPHAPIAVWCTAFTATSVTLEFRMECEARQLKCNDMLTDVSVEIAGVLSWAAVRSDRVIYCARTNSRPMKEIEGSPGNAMISATYQVKILGLTGATAYGIRVWVANSVGWSATPSMQIECRTSSKPERPSWLSAVAVGPHMLALSWHVTDPTGAPVTGGEVEIREETLFAKVVDQLTQPHRCAQDQLQWKQVVSNLKAAAPHVFRVRAANDAGLSEWSGWCSCSTPAAPEILDVVAVGILLEEEGTVAVTFRITLHESAGSSAVLCVATCCKTGRCAIATRDVGVSNHWTAQLLGIPADEVNLQSNFAVRAASGVGWSEEHIVNMRSLLDTVSGPLDLLKGKTSAIRIGAALLATELSKRRETRQSMSTLLRLDALETACLSPGRASTVTDAAGEMALKTKIAVRCEQLVMETEASLKCEISIGTACPPGSARAQRLETWYSTAGALTEISWPAASSDPLAPLHAMKAFQLLIEGGICLQAMCRERMEPLWEQIQASADVLPDAWAAADWEERATIWKQQLEDDLSKAWPPAIVTALNLLSAVDGHADLAPAAATVPQDIQGLLSVRATLESEYDELREILTSFHAVNKPGAEVALSIYELDGTSTLTAVTELAGLGGFYHVGVEVYWLEWSFGWCASGTGVTAMHIGESTLGTFKERVPLGETPCSVEETLAILNDLRSTWHGSDYNALRRNCAHFCAELTSRLEAPAAPAWVNKLAATGDKLAQWLASLGFRNDGTSSMPAMSIASVRPTSPVRPGSPSGPLLGSLGPMRHCHPDLPPVGSGKGIGIAEDGRTDASTEAEEGEEADWSRAIEFVLARAESAEKAKQRLQRMRRQRAHRFQLPAGSARKSLR